MSWSLDAKTISQIAKQVVKLNKQPQGWPGTGGTGNGQQGGGKGGNGQPNTKGKGKGKGNKEDLCSVCGKLGHTKGECWGKDKTCSHCGMTGHLKAVCRDLVGGGSKDKGEGKGGGKAGTAPTDQPSDKSSDPWMCNVCLDFCTDPYLKLCPTWSCRAKKIPKPKIEDPSHPLQQLSRKTPKSM